MTYPQERQARERYKSALLFCRPILPLARPPPDSPFIILSPSPLPTFFARNISPSSSSGKLTDGGCQAKPNEIPPEDESRPSLLTRRCSTDVNEASINDSPFLFFFLFTDAPRVELALGASISPESIYEGGDVYFDCRIDAQPPPRRIAWKFNVRAQFLFF